MKAIYASLTVANLSYLALVVFQHMLDIQKLLAQYK